MIVESWDYLRSIKAKNGVAVLPEILKFMANNPQDVELGSHKLMGDLLKANVMQPTTKEIDKACFEVHHRYIDVQTVLGGYEYNYCRPTAGLKPQMDFNEADDYQLFDLDLQGSQRIFLHPGNFVIYFPGEAHCGCICDEKGPQIFKKVVFKIDISQW